LAKNIKEEMGLDENKEEDLMADLDALLEDTPVSSDGSSNEFDGLMDLAEFEGLDSGGDLSGLDSLFENSGEDDNSTDVGAEHSPEEVADFLNSTLDGLGIDDSAMNSIDETEAIDIDTAQATDHVSIPEPEKTKETSVTDSQEDVSPVAEPVISEKEADQEMPEIDQVNDELLLDVPELGEEANIAKKEGIIHKLFANVPDENAEKNAAKEAERLAAKEAKKAAKKTKEEIAMEKEEAKKAKEEAAAAKKAEQEEKKAQKAALKAQKAEEKAAKKAARAEAIAAEEAKEPPTRLNRVGVSIVFGTFAVIALAIIFGNNSYAYAQCVAKAAHFFGMKEYTQAYNQIYGVDVKEKDQELKDQVMTVMFIQKQLNSFDNYFAMEAYPEALDSLLKGLDKYNKYLDQARSLGIESDLNYVRDEIVAQLKSAFNISEGKAKSILAISDPSKYTEQVTKAANGI